MHSPGETTVKPADLKTSAYNYLGIWMKKYATRMALGVAAAATSLLIACGGGGGGSPAAVANVTGKFVDAATKGLGYRCGAGNAVTGTTDATGSYTCPAGQPVTFSVGGIDLGTVSAPLAVVTPLELIGEGATPAHVQVVKIVRFLMSISATDPATGTITIDPAVVTVAAGKKIDFAKDADSAIDALIAAVKPGAKIFSGAEATTHLSGSVKALFAGVYKGNFSGALSGTWSITIDKNAAISVGTYTPSGGPAGTITGSVGTTFGTGSTYVFTGNADGAVWAGTLNTQTGKFSGTWRLSAQESGTFTN